MSKVFCGIDRVKCVPGDVLGVHTIKLNVRSYAGFTNDGPDHMFGCLYEAQPCMGDDDVANYPLMLWFNGGPGGPSMFGAMTENGPYQILATGEIVENPYAWNQKAHIMYWDNPVGTGYSYNEDGDYVTSEEQVGERIYQALQIFFKDERYQKYLQCPLWVTGESYGGKYIPAICNYIRQRTLNPDGSKITPAGDVWINLKGMAIGNPYMDPVLQTKKRLECGLELGFLDTTQHQKLMGNVKLLKAVLQEAKKTGKFELYHDAFNYNQGIKKDLIACGGNVAIYDVRSWDEDPLGPMMEEYFNLEAVKEALHVLDSENRPWLAADETGPVTFHLIEDFMTPTSQSSLQPFLDQQKDDGEQKKKEDNPAYQVLIYTGNLDMSCGIAGTEKMLRKLDWRYHDEWQDLEREVWASPRTATKGFVKSYANLTQIVVPRSGHMVPTFRPKISLEMINAFISAKEPPKPNKDNISAMAAQLPTYQTPIGDKYPDEVNAVDECE